MWAGEVVTQPHHHQAIALQQGFRRRYRVSKEGLVIRIAACAVHQHADLEIRGGVDDPLSGIRIGQVDGKRPCLGTGAFANALCHLVEHVLATSDEDDLHALTRESLGEQRPAAVGSADDYRPWPILVREVSH